MLSLSQILEYYPQSLRIFRKHLLQEYLQYKILEIIFNSKFASSLVFLGGSALRIVYQNQRFSEDLDFDNLGLSQREFAELSGLIQKKLNQEGLTAEAKLVFKAAYRCYIKISKLLYAENLSDMASEKLVIQIDAMPHNFEFYPQLYALDKFDVYTKIKVTPIDLILAQKIFAILNRKRRMGRDFFDVDFLINNKNIIPDFKYLKEKINVSEPKALETKLKKELKNIDFKKIAKDVEVFLFDPKQKTRVEEFYPKIDTWKID